MTPDPDMPDYLRRHPLSPEREAASTAAWKARAEEIRQRQISMDLDLKEEDRMVSLVRVTLAGDVVPRLGNGQCEVKLLALGEKWARFDAGPPWGTFTVRRAEWDGLEKEVLVTNLDTTQTNGEGAPATPPARKKREKKVVAPAKGKKAAAPKAAAGGGTSKKDVLWGLLTGGKPITYAAACKAVYGKADVPAIGGVIVGCTIRATEQNMVLQKDGKGKEATFTLRKKRKGD